jgi:hypothetical protein
MDSGKGDDMSQANDPRKPTAEEIEEAAAKADELIERIAAVPEDERKVIESDKFDGPVGNHVLEDTEEEE